MKKGGDRGEAAKRSGTAKQKNSRNQSMSRLAATHVKQEHFFYTSPTKLRKNQGLAVSLKESSARSMPMPMPMVAERSALPVQDCPARACLQFVYQATSRRGGGAAKSE
jgi:hypothetical protein